MLWKTASLDRGARALAPKYSRQLRSPIQAVMLPHEPTWPLVGLVSAGSVALGAIATAGIMNALSRRTRSSEPQAKRQKLAPPSPVPAEKPVDQEGPASAAADHDVQQQEQEQQATQVAEAPDDAPVTPDAEASAEPHGMPHPDSVVDLQKLQELEQRVADLNALAELGKVYQDSLALSAQLRNLSSFRLQQDKVLGRGSLAVVQEGEYAGDSVAVKLLPIGSVFAEDSRKEACLALCLHHPNIVRVVGVHLVEVESKPYLALVQETAPGGDLGWQIEDCDFHTGRGGSASMDVALKLLLDAARGLAYMHDVDVVHGDVKSRNLLVFWEDEQLEGEEEQPQQAGDGAGEGPAAQPAAGGAGEQQEQQQQQEHEGAAAVDGGDKDKEGDESGRQRVLVWGLKWCDFGVSFRAAEAPAGTMRTVTGTPGFRAPEVMNIGWSKAADTYAFGVIAWQLLTGHKPIVYDREWRMHVPHPNLMRCDRAGGEEEPPRALSDLVWDCGAYSAADRPSMREVVQRLEDIAMQRLQKQQAEQAQQQAAAVAADSAAADSAAAEQAAEAAAAAAAAAAELEQQKQAAAAKEEEAASAAAAAADQAAANKAAAAQQAATDNTAAAAMPPPSAAHHIGTCPTCQQPSPRCGFGGLARALSIAAREAAAGGAAADAAAAAHQQHLLHQREAAAALAAATAAAGAGAGSFVGCLPPSGSSVTAAARQHHHTYEVLIQNDDDPITAEAVAHTLDHYEAGSLGSFSKVLAGHPQALQQHHQQQQQQSGSFTVRRGPAGAALHHCATAPVHSHLLDTAADVAAAAVAAGAAAAQGAAGLAAGGVPMPRMRSTTIPSSPINILGAVSRSNIELLPAQGPGGVGIPAPSTATPPSPGAAAALISQANAAAAAAAAAGTQAGAAAAAAAAAGGSGATPASPAGWYLASGSSFKKGMWLEKCSAAPTLDGGSTAADTADSAAGPTGRSVSWTAGAAGGATGGPAAAAGTGPLSPLLSSASPGGAGSLPDAAALLHGSFSLQLRREALALPSVAEDETEGAWQVGDAGKTPPDSLRGGGMSLPAGWDSRGLLSGQQGVTNKAVADGNGPGAGGEAAAAAARMLRRQTTTRRLGTDVLAAAGALSKALSAFSSASQVVPSAAGGAAAAAAGVDGSTAGSSLLLTPDFVTAARGLSEALAALLPSAAALAEAEPDQGAAAATAASEAVAGLKTLQSQMAAAAAAAAAVGTSGAAAAAGGTGAGVAAGTGDVRESAFAAGACSAGSGGDAAGGMPVSGLIVAQAIDIPGATRSNAHVLGRGGSQYGIWGVEPSDARGGAEVVGAMGTSSSFGPQFSFGGVYGSTGAGAGSAITRRHSCDGGGRPSFVAAGSVAAAGAAGAGAAGSPVLLRMPSSRRRSAELRRV